MRLNQLKAMARDLAEYSLKDAQPEDKNELVERIVKLCLEHRQVVKEGWPPSRRVLSDRRHSLAPRCWKIQEEKIFGK